MCNNSFFVSSAEVAIMRKLRFDGHTLQSIAEITRRSMPTVHKWTATHAVGTGRYYDRALARNLVRPARNVRPDSKIVPTVKERLKVPPAALVHFEASLNSMHAAYDALKAG